MNNWHPYFHNANDSSICNWINVLSSLYENYKIEMVVPGHGDFSTRRIIGNMHTYLTDIYDNYNNDEKLKILEDQYAYMFSQPFKTGFWKTVYQVRNERRCY